MQGAPDKASFSIIRYQFDKINIDLENHLSEKFSLKFDTTGVFDSKNSIYELTFSINVFNKEQENKPFIFMRCKGLFKFENINSIGEIPDFFYSNSIAILFPFVRAYVNIATTQANIPGIMLPTLNLSSLGAGLKKDTTQK